MQYGIVYLIRGRPRTYQQCLTNELSKKFRITNLNKHITPHVTLKAPFKTNKIKVIESIILNLCKDSKKYPVKIKGFGNFGKEVIFLDVRFSLKAKRIYKKLLKELKKIKWVSFNQYDGLGTFHATLAYAKNEDQFSYIMKYIKKRKPSYGLEFDNISLLKKVGKNWKIYKVFEIK